MMTGERLCADSGMIFDAVVFFSYIYQQPPTHNNQTSFHGWPRFHFQLSYNNKSACFYKPTALAHGFLSNYRITYEKINKV
jgi:hypothetical protein